MPGDNPKYRDFLRETTALTQGEKSYQDLQNKRGVKFSPKEIEQGNAAYDAALKRLVQQKSEMNPLNAEPMPEQRVPVPNMDSSGLAKAFDRFQGTNIEPQEEVEISADEMNAPRSSDESNESYQKRLKLQALMRLRGQ